MKHFLTLFLFLAVALTGCVTKPPETITNTVYEPVPVATIDVVHPPLPSVVTTPGYDVEILTVKTFISTLKKTVSESLELTKEDKEILNETLETVEILQLNKDPLIYAATNQKNSEEQAVYMEKLVTALEEYREIVLYYRKQDAVIIVE